jgi:hypothetical protein
MNTSVIVPHDLEEEPSGELAADIEDEGHSRLPFAFGLLVTGGLLVLSSFLPDQFDAFDYVVIFSCIFATEGVLDSSQKFETHPAHPPRTAAMLDQAALPNEAMAEPPLLYAS